MQPSLLIAMLRLAPALIISTALVGTLYWLNGRDEAIGRSCGGDFHIKPCPEDLVCVPRHPWGGGMGTGGTCQRPISRDASSSMPTFPAKVGNLIPPVQGPSALAFNETTRNGGTSRGLVWEPAPPADVVSPGGGNVVYAEDFRGYGNLVIIQAGGGYQLLIAGLSTLAVKHGDAVQPGTLLGTATAKASAPGRVANADRPTLPTIYFELRRDGEPIDPSPWMPSP